MKVAVFGVGLYYVNRKSRLCTNVEIIIFLDNNNKLWGKQIDGIEVVCPERIHEYEYDRIVLMSAKAYEMKRQLVTLGVDEKKIYYFEEHLGDMEKGELQVFTPDNPIQGRKREKILIVSDGLAFNGGSLTAVYCALALMERGFQVALASSWARHIFVEETVAKGITIIIYGNLKYAKAEELSWADYFDKVIVNTLPMIRCAVQISGKKTTYWWVHESPIVYESVTKEFCDITEDKFRNMDIYAVSQVAKDNFKKYYNGSTVKILPYGIPDEGESEEKELKKNKLIFALVGMIHRIKGQDVLLDALEQLTERERLKAEFWIIGALGENSPYGKLINDRVRDNLTVKLLGEKDREEMRELYGKIDIVLNPSRQDTGPIVITEGMMHGKVCVTTEVTGMAAYIEHGKNGLICQAGSGNSLYETISWILSHGGELKEIGKNARKTYEKYFTLEKLGERLEKAISSDRMSDGG